MKKLIEMWISEKRKGGRDSRDYDEEILSKINRERLTHGLNIQSDS